MTTWSAKQKENDVKLPIITSNIDNLTISNKLLHANSEVINKHSEKSIKHVRVYVFLHLFYVDWHGMGKKITQLWPF